MKDLFKKNSTVVFLLLALIAIVVVGFWFSKPTITSPSGKSSDLKTKLPAAPDAKGDVKKDTKDKK